MEVSLFLSVIAENRSTIRPSAMSIKSIIKKGDLNPIVC
jgi:hypothetical protein